MTTAAEYRAWAEESLKWASEAVTPEERDAHIRSAEFWLQSALRSERLSQQPPTTEYEWVLPPFQEWRRKGTHFAAPQNLVAIEDIADIAKHRHRK